MNPFNYLNSSNTCYMFKDTYTVVALDNEIHILSLFEDIQIRGLHLLRLFLALFAELLFIIFMWIISYFIVLRKFSLIREIVGI